MLYTISLAVHNQLEHTRRCLESVGDWERSMALPAEVEGKTVTASYEDGILELRLPKTQSVEKRKVPINGPLPAPPPRR